MPKAYQTPTVCDGTTQHRVPVGENVDLVLHDWGGDGPLILLHHANGFCAATWGEVARALRGEARILALDARGHGEASVPSGRDAHGWSQLAQDLRRVAEHLLSQLGREAIDLMVGHSFGGTVTLSAAEHGLFKQALALDPVILPRTIDPARLRGNPMAASARRRKRVFASRQDARMAWEAKPFFARWHPKVFEDYLHGGLRELPDGSVELKCHPETEATVFEGSHSLDVFERAANIAIPVVIQWAEHGNFSRGLYQELASHMAAATVETVSTGHLVPMERPDLVAARIRALLRP